MDNNPWLDENSMTNILSFGELANQYRITYDSEIAYCFYCHTQTGIVEFRRTEEGLYSILLPEGYKDEVRKYNNNIPGEMGHSHVATTAENRNNYSTRKFNRAKLARKLYHIIGAPSTKNYKTIL